MITKGGSIGYWDVLCQTITKIKKSLLGPHAIKNQYLYKRHPEMFVKKRSLGTMSPDLQKKLVKRFPILYRGIYKSPSETCMCWGFTCGDGWYNIIWQLSLSIEEELNYSWLTKILYKHIDNIINTWNSIIKTLPEDYWDRLSIDNLLTVAQVKQKFGTLRYYIESVPQNKRNQIYTYIDLAEFLTQYICEYCGDRGELDRSTGWVEVLCEVCKAEKQKRLKIENDYYKFKRLFQK